MTLEELEEVITNIFAAQGKTVSDKIVKVWCKEIASKSFYDEAIRKAEQELMTDDNEKPTLPKVLEVIYKYHNEIKASNFKKFECDYCNGLNYVYTTLFFSKTGYYLSQSYAIKCYHNDIQDGYAKMILDEKNHNKTPTANGYMLVFKDIVELEAYLEKVKANNWFDLWVEQEKPKAELVPFYPPKEEELVSENLVIPEPEEYVPEEEEIEEDTEESIPF